MTRKQIVSTLSQFCQHDDRPRRILLEAGFKVTENETGRRIKEEEMYEVLKESDAVLAAVEPYRADLLARLDRLECISRCGAGTDAIDLEAAQKYGKKVYVTREEIAEPVAQATIAMIFALAKNHPLHFHDFREGLWQKHTSALLSEWTIGLVGFGQIGRRVAAYLKPFGSKILATDPNLTEREMPKGVTLCDLETLLAHADLVSLHAGRSPREGYLFTREIFSKMKSGSYFVNTARGYMVDEKALEEVLSHNRLGGAALDVFEKEPYRGPLAKNPKVLCTPHVCTLTKASRIAMELRCAQNIIDHFKRK